MMVFSQYAIQVVMAFMMLVMIFMILPRAQVAAGRINEVLDTEASIKDGGRAEGEPGRAGEIEFRDVTFRYPDAEGAPRRDGCPHRLHGLGQVDGDQPHSALLRRHLGTGAR